MAHARVTRVDVSAALARPGVVAAYTGADLADDMGGLPTAWTVSEDMKTPPHLPIAQDKVRYVGDAVAVVVATDRYAAADALEAVEVDYEPLPAVLDMEAALADGARSSTTTSARTSASPTTRSTATTRPRKAKADVVLHRRYINQRLIPSAMEPRAVVVDPTAGVDSYTIWSATQVPHFVRIFMSLVDRHPGAQDPGDRPRRGRRLRLEAGHLRRGGDLPRRWPGSSAGRSSGPRRAARTSRRPSTAAT